MIFLKLTIAHDKGKPAARQGRKAVESWRVGTVVTAKIVWLPKAIEETNSDFLAT
jgi:hypothetical protein